MLTEALLRALNWYGGGHGEDSAPNVRIKLLVKAIDLWLLAGKNEPDDAIAGYQWQVHSNWGKSYEAISLAFESHLVASKHASSVNESILLACLYRSSFPLDFQIPDIPSELPYRSSTIWVNFVHGVHLANAIDPMLLQRLSVQQLINLPTEYMAEGNAEILIWSHSQDSNLLRIGRSPMASFPNAPMEATRRRLSKKQCKNSTRLSPS